MPKIPQWAHETLSRTWGGVKISASWLWKNLTETWAAMSPEAKSFTKGLAIGFSLGALSVGMLT